MSQVLSSGKSDTIIAPVRMVNQYYTNHNDTHVYLNGHIITKIFREREREEYETGEGKGGRENERLTEKDNSFVYMYKAGKLLNLCIYSYTKTECLSAPNIPHTV